MKYMITAALALCLVGGAASAQDRDHGGDRGGGRPEGHQGGGGGGPGSFRGGAPQAAPQFQGGGREGFRGGDRGGDFRGVPAPGPGFRGGGDQFRGGDRRGPEPGFRPGGYLRDHGWRGVSRTFRIAPYRYPSGWGYRHWAFGAFLPFVFLAPDYTLYDYWTFGLPAPPPGYHWIRVGPDALLVRYGDGYVLDAAYGLFY